MTGVQTCALPIYNVEEVERWVLSWGTHATVIAPQMLVARIERVTAELNRRYAKMS